MLRIFYKVSFEINSILVTRVWCDVYLDVYQFYLFFFICIVYVSEFAFLYLHLGGFGMYGVTGTRRTLAVM